MPRKTAGRKYPHVTTAAKPHNHQFCPVVLRIANRAANGEEDWGTIHRFPGIVNEADAHAAKQGLYAARYCREITKTVGESVSVRANYEPDGETWTATLQVWPRSVAKQEIARRVRDGEKLAYNVIAKGQT